MENGDIRTCASKLFHLSTHQPYNAYKLMKTEVRRPKTDADQDGIPDNPAGFPDRKQLVAAR